MRHTIYIRYNTTIRWSWHNPVPFFLLFKLCSFHRGQSEIESFRIVLRSSLLICDIFSSGHPWRVKQKGVEDSARQHAGLRFVFSKHRQTPYCHSFLTIPFHPRPWIPRLTQLLADLGEQTQQLPMPHLLGLRITVRKNPVPCNWIGAMAFGCSL